VSTSALLNVRKFFPKVKTVSDARSDMRVEVTKKDEAVSHKKDHNNCAMAVACKRKMHLDGVIVARTTMYLVKGNNAIRYKLSEAASREVVSFDRGGGFAPGTYLVNAPSPSIRLGAKAGGHSRDNKGNGKPKQLHHYTTGIRAVLGAKT
jgi:hypothetical protein